MTNLTMTSPGISGAARYEVLKGDDFYGVVDTSDAVRAIVARFPLNSTGWFDARRRCEDLELGVVDAADHGPISSELASAPVGSAFVIGVGVLVGVTGLFPSYSALSSLVSQTDQLVGHLLYLLGWALVAGLMVARRQWSREASAFGVGLSAMSVGFLLSDIVTVASSRGDTAGAGIYLSLISWAICSLGSVWALVSTWNFSGGTSSRVPVRWKILPAAVIAALAIVTFALPWDRYQIVVGATGQSQIITLGNAFSNPGAVIACQLIVMVSMAAFLVLPTRWQSRRVAAALFFGALLPLAAQVFSAALQPAPALTAFGISSQMAVQQSVRLEAGYTSWFYLFCLAVALLIVQGAWMLSDTRASSDRAAFRR